MTKKEFELIAKVIWRSGFVKDKNKIRQWAKEDRSRLIASGIIGEFKQDKNFDEEKFLKDAGLTY
jgi:hypothetical protein